MNYNRIIYKLSIPIIIVLTLVILFLRYYAGPKRVLSFKNKYIALHHEVIENLSKTLIISMASNDYALIYSDLDLFLKSHENHWKNIKVYDSDGGRIYPLSEPSPLPIEEFKIIKEPILLKDVNLGNIEAALYIAGPVKQEAREVYHMGSVLIYSLVLLVLALIYYAYNLITKPLKELENASLKIAENDFDTYINLKGKDEIGDLARTFNIMAQRLKVSRVKQIELQRQSEEQRSNLDIAALVSETNLVGNITYVNRNFCEISKYTEDELLGQNHRIIKSKIHPPEFWEKMWKKITSGEIWKGEVCNQAKDGSLYWTESTIIPIKNSKDKIIKYSSIRVDITEKKETEKLLQHQSKLASIGELAAGVGHEINNPLTIATGNILNIKKVLEKENLQSKFVFKSINDIQVANERIRKIVDGLRLYSRADAGTSQVISVTDVITESLGLISTIYKKEGVDIIVNLPDFKLYTTGESGKLQQVLMNLLSNAKDATKDKGNGKITLTLSKASNEKLVISIQDNGTGMPEDIREKILDPFFTTKAAGEGTGIGLGLINEIIKKMDGEIKIESTEGEGSTFSVILPACDGTELEERERKIKEAEEEELTPLSGTVLVVDDEPGIRRILSRYLKNLGLDVEEADDGDTALVKVQEKKYDYICTDMTMPSMQGCDFIREARKLPNGDTKYFVITGGVTPAKTNKDANDEINNSLDGFITKPFTERSIYDALIASKEKK